MRAIKQTLTLLYRGDWQQIWDRINDTHFPAVVGVVMSAVMLLCFVFYRLGSSVFYR